jgi:mRNA interferase HigB
MARSQYNAWRAITKSAQWRTPRDIKTAPANDYRLVAVVQYQAGVLIIRLFGSHEEYDRINMESRMTPTMSRRKRWWGS